MATDFRKNLKRNSRHFFDRLEAGAFGLSVQASRTHYCSPRQDSDDPEFFSAFECALFENDEWVNPRTDTRFSDIGVDNWESGTCPVGGFIPVATVQAIWDRINELAARDS